MKSRELIDWNRWPVRNIDLVKQLGVARTIVTRARERLNLLKGIDWVTRGATVWYTQGAAQRILNKFVEVASHEPVRILENSEFAIFEVITRRATFINKHLVEVTNGKIDDTGQPVKFMVRVHDSTNFMPGMKFRVRNEPGSPMPVIVGRCPRYRGRW